MSHDHDSHGGSEDSMKGRILWLSVGVAIFLLVGFALPTPDSVVQIVEKYGFAQKMISWDIAHNVQDAAHKTMVVLGIIPMAVIFFATEAIPIGLTGILMPVLAYFLHLLPMKSIGKSFAGDAPMFLLGVLAMGVAVVDVGLHKRLAAWLLGWTKGFYIPIFVLCISMAVVGSFISAHAMCAFMTPVMMAVYYGSVAANSKGGQVLHEPALAKFLLFSLCFALNVGGIGSPAAGGRNVIMMGFWSEYKVPMDFFTWMTYGLPIVPLMGFLVAVYMIFLFGRKIKTKDLTPGLAAIKDETRKMGKMNYAEYVTFGMLILILALWIFGGEEMGLGGPALLALLIPVIFRTTEWRKILNGISWDAWFMYCGALTLGALLKESGAAMWLAQTFLEVLSSVGMSQGFGLWVGMSGLSGLMTNFMSDAGTTALLGPIAIPMGLMTQVHGEPWAVGLAVAFATSFAHFLIVGTPNNAIVYGLGVYPDTGERVIHPVDFLKYGFVLWVICMLVIWVVGFLVIYNVVGFPDGILETATKAMQAGTGAK
ncbi:MAG: anion permease [Desulfarculaceae bacterium]|nr:anion permease [Desulfarculaceae bacterium]MCF8046154.1 anion permease [Desulfarculaceae bacterium]MCF8065265.1 anion permease [Desulfarculaceae bacterium]MCF8097956.1 anion permease [Desulfarculaceae bacterium]MCF8123997.1 anion permease [Desulfarculaceae bacterium]